jgi:chaperone BCS1
MSFVDEAKEWSDNETKKIKSCSKETMSIYYYKKDYWTLLSKSPKRPLSTVYLRENVLDGIMEKVEKFFSPETRGIYLSFGIPYKSVQLVHGPPGTGKTSLIKSIASQLDCDLYILPISKDMLDTNLVDAFSYIADNEEKERIIVIEDIDTLFDENRKKDDTSNGITLQAFLNCLDGFTCVEGTMLFLTANKPQVLDYAMIRSCRIDNKIKLDYADEYQTRKMFETFLPDKKDKFKNFYNEIRHKEFTTAMLQEFLFYNRECEDIMTIIDKFIEIIEKNDPKNFEVIKDEQKNFYS